MSTFTTSTHGVAVPDMGLVDVTVTAAGEGFPFLLLHGGGGPRTMQAFAERLAEVPGAHVIMPTHPGFDGTVRPDALDDIPGLARTYRGLLAAMDMTNVTVIGNSLGGWIAAELALCDSAHVARVVLADAAGIEVPDVPTVDFLSLDMAEVANLSYYDPERFRVDLSTLPPPAQQLMASNRAALVAYGGSSMTDPTLRARLGSLGVPVLVVWGEADRMYTPEYGRAYADAIPGAEFQLLPGAGHLPQLEAPELLLETVSAFIQRHLG